MSPHVLVIGGQRSGKSRYAEGLLLRSERMPVYLATATPGDREMAERIASHRSRRGPDWQTIEEPLELADALVAATESNRAVLVDCLTLWLSNLLEARRDVAGETDRLISVLAEVSVPVVLVTNEVGSGIIPANALARRFADLHGILNQRMAEAVGRVVLMAAGQPLQIKPAVAVELTL